VWSARDTNTKEEVARKQLVGLSNDRQLAKRTYREIKLLQHFESHPHIITIKDIVTEKVKQEFDSIWIVMELMTTDLHKLLSSDVPLGTDHVLLFVYQILCALKAIHSANVIHRDLKPQNILINKDLDVKLCDFGTGRGHEDRNTLRMTCLKAVATPYYRAPEGILNADKYSKSVDLWALGCILAEMITRRPILPGKNNKELLRLIVNMFGCPTTEEMNKFPDSKYKQFTTSLQIGGGVSKSLKDVLPGASDEVIDLVRTLLIFDPDKRISVQAALEHPFLCELHDASDEPSCIPFVDDVEKKAGLKLKLEDYRDLLWTEVLRYQQIESPKKRRSDG